MFNYALFDPNIVVDDFGSPNGFCAQSSQIWQFIGRLVQIFKILIPVILVILGLIALGKAIVTDDDKAVKTATNGLIKKFIIAIVIFFIPSIVNAIMGLVIVDKEDKDNMTDSAVCISCIVSPSGDVCRDKVAKYGN